MSKKSNAPKTADLPDPIHIRLPERIIAKLDSIANRTMSTRSQVARQLLAEAVERADA